LERVLEDLSVGQLGVDLRALFEHVERRHDQIVEKTGHAAADCERQWPQRLVQGLNVSFIEFVNGEEHGMGRAAAQLHHGPAFPEVGHSAEGRSAHPLVVNLGSNVEVVTPGGRGHLRVGFYIVKRKQQEVLGNAC
jgi:hypothetical protein